MLLWVLVNIGAKVVLLRIFRNIFAKEIAFSGKLYASGIDRLQAITKPWFYGKLVKIVPLRRP